MAPLPGLLSLAALCLIAGGTAPTALLAESATIATAANFLRPLEALETEFETATEYRIEIVSASTGQLYAQIVGGAPFDALLAADQERPRRLIADGIGDPDSLFTYAVGRLALWTRNAALAEGLSIDTLRTARYRWLAIANPDFAPYGAAARQVLDALGLGNELEGRIVRGQSIAQTFALAETQNADLGLIALSQARDYHGEAAYVAVPAGLHDPIRQDAVLLTRARDNRAARSFLEFLRSRRAIAILEQFGYSAPD